MTSKKTKEEKPKFLKLPTGPGPFAYCSLGPRKLVEIDNSACESGKEVEDCGFYFQDE